MPRKRLSMRKISEVLRLKVQCHSTNREIANACSIGVASVSEYIGRASRAGISWPLPEGMTESELECRLYPPATKCPNDRALPDFERIRKELKRKGVTLQLLWEEYVQANASAYGRSYFVELYRQWEAKAYPRMRQVHLPGDKLFVDYAGYTVPIIDRSTGEVLFQAQIYTATMGASNYTYSEATRSQDIHDWIGSNIRALEFFGGVPRAIVPDNLKSGVTSADLYEPDVNPTFHDFARHYCVAILPCRVRRPRDKAKVEKGVQVVETRILAALRNRTFFSLADLNAAIRELVADLNARETRDIPASRRVMFETTDLPALSPLPVARYELAEQAKAKVHLDYHIDVDRHYYSVHYSHIGKMVDVRTTENVVEIFLNGQRIASHVRSCARGRHTTDPAHRPRNHAEVLGETEARILGRAAAAGPSTRSMAERILTSRSFREEGFRPCLGLVRLIGEHGSTRVEAACAHGIERGVNQYRRVKEILLAMPQEEPSARIPIQHDNVRGAEYYTAAMEIQE
jgi:transposase